MNFHLECDSSYTIDMVKRVRTAVSWFRGICCLWTLADTEVAPEDPAVTPSPSAVSTRSQPDVFLHYECHSTTSPAATNGFQHVPPVVSSLATSSPRAQVEGAELPAH